MRIMDMVSEDNNARAMTIQSFKGIFKKIFLPNIRHNLIDRFLMTNDFVNQWRDRFTNEHKRLDGLSVSERA